jgi:hypothetical protein
LNQAISSRLAAAIAWLRQFSNLSILDNWQRFDQSQPEGKNCALDPERQIIFFDRGEANIQLRQTWQLPPQIHNLPTQGATIRLYLLWWAAAIAASIDGTLGKRAIYLISAVGCW